MLADVNNSDKPVIVAIREILANAIARGNSGRAPNC